MGSIRAKKLKSGKLHYYAEIRIKKTGYPPYRESANFASKKVAQSWIAKREAELQDDPKLLFGVKGISSDLTVGEAIGRYVDELGADFGRSKLHALSLLQKFPISKIPLVALSPLDISNHVNLRKNGVPELALDGVSPTSIGIELIYLYGVLDHSEIMWGVNLDMNALKRALRQLKKNRNISRSRVRSRLLCDDELIKLTKYFYEKFIDNGIPLHLILWFAIYSARRQGEIFRLNLDDDLGEYFWVRDIKNPKGSKGNHKKFAVSADCRKIIDLLKPYSKDGLLCPFNQKTIGSKFTHACHILDIGDLRFHDLRHEACTRLAEAGMTIPQIQSVSLHDSWASLQRYVAVHKRKKVLEFDDVMHVILHDQA